MRTLRLAPAADSAAALGDVRELRIVVVLAVSLREYVRGGGGEVGGRNQLTASKNAPTERGPFDGERSTRHKSNQRRRADTA